MVDDETGTGQGAPDDRRKSTRTADWFTATEGAPVAATPSVHRTAGVGLNVMHAARVADDRKHQG